MSSPTPAPKKSHTPAAVLIVLLVAAAGGYYFYEKSKNAPPPDVDAFANLKGYFRQLAAGHNLAPQYADKDGDLVADAPTDPTKFRDVKAIGFSVVGTGDEDRRKLDEAEWKDFAAALSKATGKPVEYRGEIAGPDDQMAALKDGRLHVTAFNTGAVPAAVATAGFVPLFAPADAADKFAYQALILVRADSPVKAPADLKGKTVALVGLSSNSGGRAPIRDLKATAGLLPGRDYTYQIAGDHFCALADLLDGKADAACVASDLKDRAFTAAFKARGKEYAPKAEAVRVIHTSASFPPLCFGVAHDLPPDLRAKVEQAFGEFRFAGTSVGARYAAQGKVKFARVSYKTDWKDVRDIDTDLGKLADVP